MSTVVLEALQKLDSVNDNHWNADGTPKLEALKFLAKGVEVTAEMLKQIAPKFVRTNRDLTPVEDTVIYDSAKDSVKATTPVVEATNEQPGRQSTVPSEPPAEETGLLAQLKKTEEVLGRVEKEKAQADRKFAEATAARDAVLEEIEKGKTRQGFHETMSGYFAQQAKVRAERAAQIEAMKGIDVKALFPQKAAIDKAFARKNSRGAQRPVRK